MGVAGGTRLRGGSRRARWIIIACIVAVAATVIVNSGNSLPIGRTTSHDLLTALLQWAQEHKPGTPELALLVGSTTLIASLFLAWKQRQWSLRETKNERLSARGRTVMLRFVHDRWVTVLDRALGEVPRIELGLLRRPDLVRQSLVPAETGSLESGPLPHEEQIHTVFNQTGGILLLLGAPGSGKTIALLELTRELLFAAEVDRHQPIPAVFNLASWTSGFPSFPEWLVDQLEVRYEIPASIARRWVDHGDILPLLDGIDEIDATHQESCIKAIESFHKETLTKLVVTCRTERYEELSTRLEVDKAIELQALTDSQVISYLKATGTITPETQETMRADAGLWGLLQSPLVLSIVVLAYRNGPMVTLETSGNRQQRMTGLFSAYLTQMLAHRTGRHTRHRMLRWLTSIARSMRDHHLSEFNLDRLQPELLTTATQRQLAKIGPAVIAGTIVGLADGTIYSLLRGPDDGVVNGIAWGLFFGLFVGIRIPSAVSNRRRLWLRTSRGALGGLFLALIFWLLSSSADARFAGLVFAMSFGLLADLRKAEPVEVARRSWTKTGLGAVSGIIGGAIIGLLYSRSYGLADGTTNSLVFASSFAAACGIIAGLVNGLVPELIEKRARPNEGIHRSARRALALGLPAGIVSGIIFALVFERTSGMMDGIGQGLRDGLIVGLAVALFYGGLACLQHISIRGILVCYRQAPVDYVRFLDEATDRLIMRRTGSGYIFTHGLLLKYIADLGNPEKNPDRRRPR